MPTLDDLRQQRDLFIEHPELRPKPIKHAARPTRDLADNGETCKTCKNAFKQVWVNWKCELNRNHWTGGAATDIRLSDPACGLWEAK